MNKKTTSHQKENEFLTVSSIAQGISILQFVRFEQRTQAFKVPVILSNRDFPVEGLGLVTCRVKQKH